MWIGGQINHVHGSRRHFTLKFLLLPSKKLFLEAQFVLDGACFSLVFPTYVLILQKLY